MHLIDGDRRVGRLALAARLHPGVVAPAVIVRLRNDGSGAGRRLGLSGDGVGLPRRPDPARTGDVVFVSRSRRHAGNEQLPDSAAVAHAHGVPPAIPGIEIADDGDARGVRRPTANRTPLTPSMATVCADRTSASSKTSASGLVLSCSRPDSVAWKRTTPSACSNRWPAARQATRRCAKPGSANASVSRPTRRPRRTRASASRLGNAADGSSSQRMASGSSQQLAPPPLFTSTSPSRISRPPRLCW